MLDVDAPRFESKAGLPKREGLESIKAGARGCALRITALALSRQVKNKTISNMSLTYRWPILRSLRLLRALQIACEQRHATGCARAAPSSKLRGAVSPPPSKLASDPNCG